ARLLELFAHGAVIRVSRKLQHADALQARQQLTQQRETLGVNLWANKGKACDITAGAGEARDETGADRVASGPKKDWYRGRGILGRLRGGRAPRHDDFHVEPNELLREGAEELGSAVGVASFDEQIPAHHPAESAQRRVFHLEVGRSWQRTRR